MSRLSKCVDAVRSLTMSIFLLVRFVTSVTKKKSLFPQCDGCLAFQSHFKRLEWDTFLLLEREFDFNMYLFLPSKLRMPPLPRQGCSLPGTILKTSGVKKKRLKDTPSVWTQEICVRLEVTPSLLPACGPRVVTAKSWRIMVRNVFSVLRFVSAKEKRDRMRHGAVDSCLIGP